MDFTEGGVGKIWSCFVIVGYFVTNIWHCGGIWHGGQLCDCGRLCEGGFGEGDVAFCDQQVKAVREPLFSKEPSLPSLPCDRLQTHQLSITCHREV